MVGTLSSEVQHVAQAALDFCKSRGGAVPESDMISRLAKTGARGQSSNNCERDLQRIVLSSSKTLDVQIETVQVRMLCAKTMQKKWRSLPCIFPDKLAESVFHYSESLFRHLFLGTEVDATSYWQCVRDRSGWFSNHPASTVPRDQWDKLIPISLYGDEVQSFRNTEGGVVACVAWTPDFAVRMPTMSRYFALCAWPEHYACAETYDDLLRALAPRLSAMCSPTVETFAWRKKGYRFVYSSTQGDLKWIAEKYGFHNFRSNSFCSFCECKKDDPDPSMTIGDFKLTAKHLQTEMNHETFFQRLGKAPEEFSPLFLIAGARMDRIAHDICHSQFLGTGKTLNGSLLTYLCEANAFCAFGGGKYQQCMDAALRHAYKAFCDWQRARKLWVSQPRFTASRLHRTLRTAYPQLSSKAVAGKTISYWLADVCVSWAQRPASSDLDQAVAYCATSYTSMLRAIDESPVVLSQEQAEAVFQHGVQHLQVYAYLNLLSASTVGYQAQNRALWLLLPKHHHMQHMVMECRRSRINPNSFNLLTAESFIGVMGRVSKTCHRTSLSLRVLERYKLLFSLHLRRLARDNGI